MVHEFKINLVIKTTLTLRLPTTQRSIEILFLAFPALFFNKFFLYEWRRPLDNVFIANQGPSEHKTGKINEL